MSTALVPIEKMTGIQIFTAGQVDAVLERIESEARAEAAKLDISTKTGREAIASLAYKVARSKTFLDDKGKELTEEIAKQKAAVDAERRRVRERLDALKDDVRKPLTDWENAEKARVGAHEDALAALEAIRQGTMTTLGDVAAAAEKVKTLRGRDWQEFDARAKQYLGAAFTHLKESSEAIKKAEADRLELQRLRAEQLAQEQRERDERIAHEAAERERKLAEAREAELRRAAEAERLRVERERNEAEARAKQAEAAKLAAEQKAEADRLAGLERERLAEDRREREAQEAIAKAKREQEQAVERERQRQEDERQKQRDEAEAREKNLKHVKQIDGEVKQAILTAAPTITTAEAQLILAALKAGAIPHTRIAY